MRRRATSPRLATAASDGWAKKLADDVAAVMARHPEADPEPPPPANKPKPA